MANMTLKEWKNINSNTPLRVVFYGRVSTEHEMQLSAFQNQMQWYEDIASQNANWNIVAPIKTYLDKGITGTLAKKRPGFIRMIKDAQDRKFDMVVTRDVSRFGRNTVEAVDYSRKLKALGVQVFFVTNNIRSIQDDDADFKLELMAMLAENESRSTSAKVKAGQYIARQNGVLYGSGNIMGYKRVKFHQRKETQNLTMTFVIDEEQAETVRMIFSMYLSGMGLRKIKVALEQEGRKTASGKTKWNESNISRILQNPMYIGKQLQCQTVVEDFLTHERVKNPKEEVVVIDGDFDHIIDDETFQKVKQKLDAAGAVNPFKHETGASFTEKKWASKLECNCGSTFNSSHWHPKGDGTINRGYVCRHRKNEGTTDYRLEKGLSIVGACDSKSLPEWHLELAGITVFSSLLTDKREAVLGNFELIERCYCSNQNNNSDSSMKELMKKIQKYTDKLQRLVELYTGDDIGINEYREMRADYEAKISQAKAQLEKLQEARNAYDPDVERDDDLIRAFEALAGFVNMKDGKVNDIILRHYVDKVVVRPYGFDFLINLKGDAVDFKNSQGALRKNETYEKRAERTNKMIDEQYQAAFFSILDFETARKYRKDNGDYLRTNQWDDKVVKVFIRK